MTTASQHPLRILNVSQNYFVYGGSDTAFLFLEEVLRRRGHQVVPFAAADDRNLESLWSHYFPKGARLDRPKLGDIASFIYSPAARIGMSRLLREQQIDLCHLHIYYGRLTASILAPLTRKEIPIVQTLHEYRSVCPVSTMYRDGQPCWDCVGFRYWQAVRHRCNRGSLARSILSTVETYASDLLGAKDKIACFITVSDFQRQQLVAMGMPPAKLRTVHNAVSNDTFTDIQGRQEYVLYLGRIEDYKGVFTLLTAAKRLRNIRFIFVGEGSKLAAARTFAEQENLHHVTFTGKLSGSALSEMMQNALCLVQPSEWYETFGLTVIEAFAKGVPVIASRIGGMTETIADGTDGFLFTPGDVTELTDCVQRLIDNPGQAQRMGEAGRQKAQREYSENAFYRKIIDVYRVVLA